VPSHLSHLQPRLKEDGVNVCAYMRINTEPIPHSHFLILASMIAMLTIGPIVLIAFGIYEWKFASRPIVPMKFLHNKAIVGASLIGFFDFISFYLTSSYLYSFVFVFKGW
jgi:hypothetical protein